MDWILYICNALAVPACSPLVLGIIRKTKARMQNRKGASVLQPYRDLAKLFRKDEIISEDASWVFTAAPYVIFGTTLALAAGVPLISPYLVFIPMADILVFIYILAAGTFFLALAGMDTGSGFGGFGASREMMISAIAEGGFILSLIAASFIAGTSNLAAMILPLSHTQTPLLLPLILAGVAFGIVLLAENARYPVDNPSTHLELTMVHEAVILEFSGTRLALMEWAASNKLLIFIAVFVNLFFPWGLAFSLSPSALATASAIFFGKVVFAGVAIGLIESIMAKFRIFRVPDLLYTSCVLSIIAILIVVI